MFDIGFLELVVIAIVALVVIGPERLPGAIRTGSAYVRRIRRSLSDIRQEIEQELHNDAVMRDLKDTRDQLNETADQLKQSAGEMHRSSTEAGTQLHRNLQSPDAPAGDKPGRAAGE